MKKIKIKMSAISAVFTVVVLACLIVFNMLFGVIADKIFQKTNQTTNRKTGRMRSVFLLLFSSLLVC